MVNEETPKGGVPTGAHSQDPEHREHDQIEALRGEIERLWGVHGDIDRGDLSVKVEPGRVYELLKGCKENPRLGFAMLIDITVVDWMDAREDRFEVVYQLLSLVNKQRLTVKAPVSESSPELPSVVSLWAGANFLEREAWDMFGIVFRGHPDLRRILMYDEFVGHPLRKDYPLQGKQPRVPLRMPEVENTARRMERGELVQIRRRSAPEGSAVGVKGI